MSQTSLFTHPSNGDPQVEQKSLHHEKYEEQRQNIKDYWGKKK